MISEVSWPHQVFDLFQWYVLSTWKAATRGERMNFPFIFSTDDALTKGHSLEDLDPRALFLHVSLDLLELWREYRVGRVD